MLYKTCPYLSGFIYTLVPLLYACQLQLRSYNKGCYKRKRICSSKLTVFLELRSWKTVRLPCL